jgi:glutamine phosphoribosylpyrophosphate amidotransferase
MCGVVGYWSKEANQVVQIDMLAPLVSESKIRGLHAFGASYFDCESDEIVTVKYPELDNLLGHLTSVSMSDAIVHTRYSTSGDWRDMRNNQPLCVAGYSLVFNGVIDMRTKEEMEEAYGMVMETDNDGELFIQHLMDGGDPVEFIESCGSFAGLWYDGDGVMYALRNAHRPLWYFRGVDCIFFVSTNDIIKRAVGRKFAACAVECEPGKLYNVEEMLYASA